VILMKERREFMEWYDEGFAGQDLPCSPRLVR